MKPPATPLAQILEGILSALRDAPTDTAHPFRFAVLATARDTQPAARVVVLRRADPASRELVFHTDIRSPKIHELRENPTATWVFFDPQKLIQIRTTGRADIHNGDAIAEAAWQLTPPVNRINYASTLPSGTPLAEAQDIATPRDDDTGRANFAVVITQITQLDWLQIEPTRQRRAQFTWQTGEWHATWLVP